MDASRDDVRCGLCGQVEDARHQWGHEESGRGSGGRVEHVVVGLRGATAHCRAVHDPSRAFRTGADVLAEQLGIDLSDLPGRHYTCWETPGEYGVIRSRFELA
ncbi:hypothetical protein ACIRD6_34860 [Streptomyces sp. NPDC102473]|uniref:hypothetical protein n=1 Tax=Streptomyces sp. NPDC102473 TaxID=3366180 RepID=UPI00381DCE8E